MDWRTEHILNRVRNGENDHLTLGLNGLDNFNDGKSKFEEPICMDRNYGCLRPGELEDIDRYKNKLDSLFTEDNSDLVLEIYEDHGSEGGECYQAYIIKGEHQKALQTYMDHRNEVGELIGKQYYFLSKLEYITMHPDQFIVVWAGPY